MVNPTCIAYVCTHCFIPEESKINVTGRKMLGFLQMKEIANDKEPMRFAKLWPVVNERIMKESSSFLLNQNKKRGIG